MEKPSRLLLTIISIGLVAVFVGAQVVNPTKRYCFNYTWMGPKFDNESTLNNATCEDITQQANNIPCKAPLVITYDGTPPDIDFLWENHDADTTCLLVDGEVCAKYVYRFDGAVLNVTYMCTKVVTDEDTKITSGCYISRQGSREVEVCMCRTLAPGAIPCNDSPAKNYSAYFVMMALVMVSLINHVLNR